VPKLKTNRGAAKRFKKTGTGKIKGKRAFARHILTKKSANRKRGLRTPKLVDKRDAKGIKALLPYIYKILDSIVNLVFLVSLVYLVNQTN